MANLNIAEWNPEQVAEWMSGLDEAVAQYAPALRARGLDGAKLLMLRCDDLDYLGMHIIGHQELLLEAVEHLRNFHYELSRECIQQLALRVWVYATAVVRALRGGGEGRLETQALADVARAVRSVQPLVCWLDAWGGGGGALAASRAALLRLALEAATCAQRDRFAETPARAVAAAAAASAAAAAHIARDLPDPAVLAPAVLASVALRVRGARGFRVRACRCGRARLVDVAFGSAAHASGAVRAGDEVVGVGARCVLGWAGAAVERACDAAGPELQLRVLRRAPAARAPPRRRRRADAPAPAAPCAPGPPASDSDSDAHSPPRLYGRRPRAPPPRRHSVGGGSPAPELAAHRFWRSPTERRRGLRPEPDAALYARDKAVSCSTGLEVAPRPRAGGAPGPRSADAPPEDPRGRLDKAHSTPAYGRDSDEPPPPDAALADGASGPPRGGRAAEREGRPKADQILHFKRSSSAIGEAMTRRGPEAAAAAPETPRARPPARPLRKSDILVVRAERAAWPALNAAPSPAEAAPAPRGAPPARAREKRGATRARGEASGGRRAVPLRALAALGASGAAWQRVRRGGARWRRRTLVVAGGALWAWGRRGARAACWARLAGCTVAAAPEVSSRPHAFKVYHARAALYFAAPSADAQRAWIALIHRATLADAPPQEDASRQFSETERSESSSSEEEEAPEAEGAGLPQEGVGREAIGRGALDSLRALATRAPREPPSLVSTSLDRKYLRFFSRHRTKDDRAKDDRVKDDKPKGKRAAPTAAEQYRSYRRAPPAPPAAPRKPPTPLNYIHASNPNLLDFEKSDFAARPAPPPPRPRPPPGGVEVCGVTLEQFMLRKQAEEARQVYSNRVLLGVERDAHAAPGPEVVYGSSSPARAPSPRPAAPPADDGYEKVASGEASDGAEGTPRRGHNERWRDSLRRNDKVHSTRDTSAPRPASPAHVDAGAEGGVSRLRLMFTRTAPQHQAQGGASGARWGGGAQYPHLQCPPTFQPETYSLATRAHAPHDQ